MKIHLASIFQQLGAPNRAAAVAIYNGWLNAQLEVLRTSEESAERPVRGQPGIVPLRRRTRRKFKYPLPANDTATLLPMAAEAIEPPVKLRLVPRADAAPSPDTAERPAATPETGTGATGTADHKADHEPLQEPLQEAHQEADQEADQKAAPPEPEGAPKGEATDTPRDDWHGIRSHVSPPNE